MLAIEGPCICGHDGIEHNFFGSFCMEKNCNCMMFRYITEGEAMPCTDPRDHMTYDEGYSSGMKEKASVVALLCSICEFNEKINLGVVMPLEVQQWWTEHKAEDMARKHEAKVHMAQQIT